MLDLIYPERLLRASFLPFVTFQLRLILMHEVHMYRCSRLQPRQSSRAAPGTRSDQIETHVPIIIGMEYSSRIKTRPLHTPKSSLLLGRPIMPICSANSLPAAQDPLTSQHSSGTAHSSFNVPVCSSHTAASTTTARLSKTEKEK